jgi:hypothetical protein
MNARELLAKTEYSTNALAANHRAPWCGPCRVTKPLFVHIIHLVIGVIVTSMACINEIWWALPVGLLEIILSLGNFFPCKPLPANSNEAGARQVFFHVQFI